MGKHKNIAAFTGLFAAIISTIALSTSVYATTNTESGLFTDSNDVRWEYLRETDTENVDEPESVSIMFYDKPETMSQIIVPSLAEVLEKVPNATSTLDTYYVRNATGNTYGEVKRTATAATTKVDFTNTSKVQIMGVKPMIDPEIETEVVFGDNIVIGDNNNEMRVYIRNATTYDYQRYQYQKRIIDGQEITNNYNYEEERTEITNRLINDIGWDKMTESERLAYLYDVQYEYCTGDNKWYCIVSTEETNIPGTFSGYKLKITGMDNIKYFGWNAFLNTVFNEQNKEIVLHTNQTLGYAVFKNTNVEKATIESNNMGTATFAGAQNLREVVFSDDVTVINEYMFADSGLTTLPDLKNISEIKYRAFNGVNISDVDLTGKNVHIIGTEAFANSHINTVKLGNVIEKINTRAFKNNNIEEIYLPKSLNDLSSYEILQTNPLRKATVAYDTQVASTTATPFHSYIGNQCSSRTSDIDPTGNVTCNLKELVVEAPYAADETPISSHLSQRDYYDYPGRQSLAVQYGYGLSPDQLLDFEFNEADQYKNVIAPGYFNFLGGLNKITIGEGYEFVGLIGFYANPAGEVTLPSTLKGMGYNSFSNSGYGSMYGDYDEYKINLPESLEYIGKQSFYGTILMKNDVDLPNLRYIGDLAFSNTGVHNVYLHDKLEFVGYNAFNGTWNLNDVTFDFDIFAESPYFPGHPKLMFEGYGQSDESWSHTVETPKQFSVSFGMCVGGYMTGVYDWDAYSNKVTIRTEDKNKNGDINQKLGTITFTDKVQTEGVLFFYSLNADKVDLKESNFKITDTAGFLHSYIGEVILPDNLEEIGAGTFVDTTIEKPLHLPDSIKKINHGAFQNYRRGASYYYGEDQQVSIVIENLPTSIETIGAYAFYYTELSFDTIDSRNLKTIYPYAFYGANIKNIHLYDGLQQMGTMAFAKNDNIKNITLDFDLTTIDIMIPGTYYNSIVSYGSSYYWNVDTAQRGDNAHAISRLNEITNIDSKQKNLSLFFGTMIEGDSGCSQRRYEYSGEGNRYIRYERWNGIINQTGSDDIYINPENGIAYYGYNENSNTYYDPVDEFNKCLAYDYNYTSSFENIIMKGDGDGGLPANFFYNVKANKIDLGETNWKSLGADVFNGTELNELILPNNLETLGSDILYEAKIANPVLLPDTIKTIGKEAFQWTDITIDGDLPTALETIGASAFYGTDIADEITIPSTVTSIGFSAFNAGDVDTHYDKVTIKPDLNYQNTADQAVFQIFWNNDIDELVVESATLPVMATLGSNPILPTRDNRREGGEPEFYGMTMQKVSLTNIPTITAYAFEACDNLEELDLSANTNLASINESAFMNDNKLATVKFANNTKDKTVHLGLMSFANTALKDISGPTSSFDLTAAKFTADEAVFAGIETLINVSVPNTFNNGIIPDLTFYADPELRSAEIGYQITEIGNKAFTDDNKLLRTIIWGKDTDIIDQADIAGIDPEDAAAITGATIPQTTDIYAYSVSIAEDLYAEDEAREGNFYALDEVMQLSSNNVRPMLNDDETDFDKSDVILYALRRDGVILESTELYNFSDAYKRTDQSGKGGFGADDDDDAALRAQYATMILDTPVPMNEVDLSNQNFEEVTFDIESSDLIRIYYEDWYSGAIRETTLTPYSEDIEVPKTGFMNAVSTTTKIALPVCPIILVAYFIYKKKQHRE